MQFNEFRLYIRNQVCLTLSDGSSIYGKLMELDPENEILRLDQKQISFSDILNVEYVGKITDIHTLKKYGELGPYRFKLEAIPNSAEYNLILYEEFDCTAACRLIMQKNEIYAENVRLLEKRHRFSQVHNHPVMLQLNNGDSLTGQLFPSQDGFFLKRLDGKNYSVDLNAVEDVIRLPEVNEQIVVDTKNARVVSGVVSAVDSEGIVIQNDQHLPAFVDYQDIAALRYYGTLNVAFKSDFVLHITNHILDKQMPCICKPAYLQQPTDDLRSYDRKRVVYSIGMNDRGFVAKNIALAEEISTGVQPEHSAVGVITYFDDSDGSGYIGNKYVTKGCNQLLSTEMPLGDVPFSAKAMDFKYDYNSIHVVRYTYIENKYGPNKVMSVKRIETYPIDKYAYVTITAENEFQAVPNYIAYLPLFQSREIEVTTTDGTIFNGWLQAVNDDIITLQSMPSEQDASFTVSIEDITYVRAYGTIGTYRPESGTGFVDNHWFHVNHLRTNADSAYIAAGKTVIYSLANTSKGRFWMANDLSLVEEYSGYLIEVKDGVASICPEEDYTPASIPKTYQISNLSSAMVQRLATLELKNYDYPVSYRIGDNQNSISIMDVDSRKGKMKPREGYVFFFYNRPDRNGYGFIEDAAEIMDDPSAANQNGSIYFKESAIVNYEHELNTRYYGYRVLYSPEDRKVSNAVAIFERFERNITNEEPNPVPQEQQANAAENQNNEDVEYLSLADLMQDVPDRENMKVGLLHDSRKDDVLFIRKSYQKIYYGKTGQSTPTMKYEKVFAHNLLFEEGVMPQFSNNIFLICYGANINEAKRTNTAVPAKILRSFEKGSFERISIEHDQVAIYGKPKAAMPEVLEKFEKLENIEMLYEDESVILSMTDPKQPPLFDKFRTLKDGTLVFDQNGSIEKSEIARIYRFAVVTAYDKTSGIGMLNGYLPFSRDVCESKMINILNVQRPLVGLHVMYYCADDHIADVRRISDDYAKYIPWEKKQVAAFDPNCRQVTLNDGSQNLLTVMSDGFVARMLTEGVQSDEIFYAQKVEHPFVRKVGESPSVQSFAVTLRCVREKLMIHYDSNKDVYSAQRIGTTISFPVCGSSWNLQYKTGHVTDVEFKPDVSGRLCAHIISGNDSDNNYENMLTPRIQDNLADTPLVAIGQYYAALKGITIDDIPLNEQGMPQDPTQAQQAYAVLCSSTDASKLFLAAKIAEEFRIAEADDSTDNATDCLKNALWQRYLGLQNNVDTCTGELAYYLSTLLATIQPGSASADTERYGLLYELFCQDFAGSPLSKAATEDDLCNLLRRNCVNISEFMAHLMLLDNVSAEWVIKSINIVPELCNQIKEWPRTLNQEWTESQADTVIHRARTLFERQYLNFSATFCQVKNPDDVIRIVEDMEELFMKLLCESDQKRFLALSDGCRNAWNSTGSVESKAKQMYQGYERLSSLEQELLLHPTPICTQMLLSNGPHSITQNLPGKFAIDTASRLNKLYKDPTSHPKFSCTTNHSVINREDPRFWLIIKNGMGNQDVLTAQDLVVSFYCYNDSQIQFSPACTLRRNLSSGDQFMVEVCILGSIPEDDVLSVETKLNFRTPDGCMNGQIIMKDHEYIPSTPIAIQIGGEEDFRRPRGVRDPYKVGATGQALDRSKMFFGRKDEIREIWEYIVEQTDDGEHLIPGRPLIIHGQKKAGKTSLVNRICNCIEDSETLKKQALILNYTSIITAVSDMSAIYSSIYGSILSQFKSSICPAHPDVEKLLREHDLYRLLEENSNANKERKLALFDEFFREFARIDQGRHTVVLIMDEFTKFCAYIDNAIKSDPSKAYLASNLDFIKTLTDYGFIQIIIGHANMMEILGRLNGLNSTSEFAKTLEVTALKPADAVQLITKPMEDLFGFDPYDTELGKEAVQKLLDLSGCHPTYLQRLCSAMFRYFMDPDECKRNRLLPQDVDTVVREYVVNDLQIENFDVLIGEDGDEIVDLHLRETYKFLKHAAKCMLKTDNQRVADLDDIKEALIVQNHEYADPTDPYFKMDHFHNVRNILEKRRVIETLPGGKVKIKVGLFCEYIRYK